MGKLRRLRERLSGSGQRADETVGLTSSDGLPVSGGRVRTGRRLVRVLPVLVIVVGVVFDFLTPTRVTAAPLYAAAPLVAAPFYPLIGTLLVAIASLVFELAVHIYAKSLMSLEALSELLTVVVVSLLALYISGVLRRSGQRLASARIIAETAQRAVLPRPAERIGGVRI
ncbi:hypothetical protein GT002_24060, partial [Streptomyces sp. SID4917]